MTKQEQKKLIVDQVAAVNGCKATELAAVPEIALNCDNLPALLEEIIKEGDLVEVEYTIPDGGFRLKSFLLPKGTVADILSY